MQPPTLTIEYAAVGTSTRATRPAAFGVEYRNSSEVIASFWQAWEVSMGIFMAFGGACAILKWYKWSVRCV